MNKNNSTVAAIAMAAIVASPFFAVCSLAAPVATNDEMIPPKVQQTTRKLVEHYLGTTDFKGIPLLDRNVSWNWFTNWPDQFTFKGQTYVLRLVDGSGGDYLVDLKSRADVKPGMALLAMYGYATNRSISASWLQDGTLWERSIHWNGQTVYSLHLYPSGRLYSFARDDPTTKDYTVDYFDTQGRLLGTERSGTGEKLARCQWRGRAVDEDAFLKLANELLQQGRKESTRSKNRP